jgi:hypothetical protein
LAAITVVAAGVRFKAFAIFVTPIFAFAMLFIWRLSLAVQARRDTFLAFAILFSESFYGESGFVSQENESRCAAWYRQQVPTECTLEIQRSKIVTRACAMRDPARFDLYSFGSMHRPGAMIYAPCPRF